MAGNERGFVGSLKRLMRRSRGRVVELDQRDAAVYAIGDVHGCFKELLSLERKILRNGQRLQGTKLIVMLGDYVDRGPHSAHVIEYLQRPLPDGFHRLCLCGNHEAMMLDFLDKPFSNIEWLDVGGVETLASYGVDIAELMKSERGRGAIKRILHRSIPSAHLAFLKNLATCAVLGNVVFVHAGLRPGLALEKQNERDMLWIREPFLSLGPAQPFIVVHGHTPNDAPVRWKGRIGLDTGAYYTGRLTALRIKNGRGLFLSS